MTRLTHNMVNEAVLERIKPDALLFNYARGGIVNEEDLAYALKNNLIKGAAIDVFEEEPYSGKLAELDNILLTQHMGSCSFDCRSGMEIEATKEIIRFFNGEVLIVPVT